MIKPTYEELTNDFGGVIIKRTDADGTVAWIPVNEANSDYQRYLNPEAEQSTPIDTLPSKLAVASDASTVK